MASLQYFGNIITKFDSAIEACRPIEVKDFTLITASEVVRELDSSILLTPYCPGGAVYIYDISRMYMQNLHILSASTPAWKRIYTHNSGYSSSLPVFVSIITFAMTSVVAMAAFMTIARHARYPLCLRVAVYYTTAEVVAMFGIFINYMKTSYNEGGNSVTLAGEELSTKPHHIASYVANILLTYSLIHVAVKFFRRKAEYVSVGIISVLLVTCAVILSGLSTFGLRDNRILAAFHDLIELSVYLLFSICLSLRALESWQAAFSKDMIVLTILAILTSWISPAIYISDFYGWWQARVIDELLPFSTVIVLVTSWYWIQKIDDAEQGLASGNQLGRRVFNQKFENGTKERHRDRLEDTTEYDWAVRMFWEFNPFRRDT